MNRNKKDCEIVKIEDIEEAIRADGGVAGEWRAYAPDRPDTVILGIGEAPGRDEQREGRPFIGQAGKLLDDLLNQCGIKAIYLTNVAKVRPPVVDRKQTAPSPEEIKKWRSYVEAEVKAIQPKYILLFGKTAAKMVVGGNFKMGDVVGQRYVYEGIETVVVFHPAMFLHDRGERGSAYKMNLWRRAVSGLLAKKAETYRIEEVTC